MNNPAQKPPILHKYLSKRSEALNKANSNKENMGYYCKSCQSFHNTDSDIGKSHRRYASQRPPQRTRKGFWDKFFDIDDDKW